MNKFILVFFVCLQLLPSYSIACKSIFTSKLKRISYKDLHNVETHYEHLSRYGFWNKGWERPENDDYGDLEFARGFLDGKRVFAKKINPQSPDELKFLRKLNSYGLGPKVIAIFRKYGGDWIVTEFLEGKLFKLDYEWDEPTMDGSDYKPNWRNNELIGRVNKKTVYAIKNSFKILDEIGLAAHDFQFLVQEDGNAKIIDVGLYQLSAYQLSAKAKEINAKIIDVGLYQLSAKAKEINAKILKVILKNLHMLLKGNPVTENLGKRNRGKEIDFSFGGSVL